MRKTILFTLIMTITSTVLVSQQKPKVEAQQIEKNPLVMEWNTPYQTPPFEKIKTEHYKPAIEFALDVAKKEVDAIIKNQEKPTFENTIIALEHAGSLLNRTLGVFFNINEANTSSELQKIAEDISPMLTRYSNDINMNPELFARVKTVYDQRDDIPLTLEQRMLLDKSYRGFIKKDRKSVVKGKSVDLGGRRIIKKKRKKTETLPANHKEKKKITTPKHEQQTKA